MTKISNEFYQGELTIRGTKRLVSATSFPGLFPVELGRRNSKRKSPGNEVVVSVISVRWRIIRLAFSLAKFHLEFS